MADSLQDLLDFSHEAMMVHRFSQFDDTKVTRTLIYSFFTLFTLDAAINSTKMRIIGALCAWSYALLVPNEKSEMSRRDYAILYVHSLGIYNVHYRQALALLWREDTESYLLNSANFGARIREVKARHGCECTRET